MSFDDLQNAWRSPGNVPPIGEIETQKTALIRRLRKQHRGLMICLTTSAAWFAVLAFYAVHRAAAGVTLDFSREWLSLWALLVPLIVWSVFFVQHRRHRARHTDYEQSILSSLRALRDQNRVAQVRAKIIALSYAVLLAVVPFIAHQLEAMGKARPNEARSLVVAMNVILGGGLLGLAYHQFRNLRPKARELETLLRAYD